MGEDVGNNWLSEIGAHLERINELEKREHELKTELKEVQADGKAARGDLLSIMQESGVASEPGHPLGTVSVRQGSMSVQVVQPEALPPKYTRTKVEPDKKAIGDALKAGQAVLGASFERGPDTLMIKWRKDNG